MGEITAISWADHTFNPVIGCMKVSPACDGCYAEALMDKRYGRVEWGAPGQGPGTRVRTSASNWREPIRWNKKAEAEGTRPFVFCASLADVFDNRWDAEWRRDLFDLIRSTPNLVWLLLTKRPQNIIKMVPERPLGLGKEWPSNAAIGTTVEDQERADLNIPHLLHATDVLKPAFNFLSCEPLLGMVLPWTTTILARTMELLGHANVPGIDWIITGGETDQGTHQARPTHPAWFRLLRDLCATTGVPYHHKQNGEWLAWGQKLTDGNNNLLSFGKDPERFKHLGEEIVSKVGRHRSGRLLDGIEHNARPQVAA